MNKLPLFTKNETKTFRFTNEQYYYLEIEYNRYIIYKSLIKQIEKILNILDTTEYNSTNNNRKKYENKNIIDRFILECINHGITPEIEIEIESPIESPIEYQSSKTVNNTVDNKIINYDLLLQNLFFNKNIENLDMLRNTSYYKKMINEYNEKKIRITPEKIIAINNAIINCNKSFYKQCKIDLNYNIDLQSKKKITISKRIT